MSRNKGVHLKSFHKFILARGGEAAWQRVLNELAEADRALAAEPAQPTEWLDYHVWWRMLLAADKVLGTGDYSLVREIGAFDARENLSGVYRIFLTFIKPEFIVARSDLIWRQYYDTGRMKMIKVENRQAEIHLTEFPDLPKHHEMELLGWMEVALNMSGFKNVQMTHPGPCQFMAAWE
jgi:hypothetical protein